MRLLLVAGASANAADDVVEVACGAPPVIFGRGSPPCIADRRCSRRQLELSCPSADSLVVLCSGTNPSRVNHSGAEKPVFLFAGDSATLKAGDRVSALADGTSEFVVLSAPSDAPAPVAAKPPAAPAAAAAVAAPAPVAAAAPAKSSAGGVAVWSWLGDMEWVEYSAEQSARIEKASQEGAERVDIDTERFVEFKPELVQRRRDEPQKHRVVRREVRPVGEKQRAAAGKALDGVCLYFPKGDIPKDQADAVCKAGGSLTRALGARVTHVVIDRVEASKRAAVAEMAVAQGKRVVWSDWLHQTLLTGSRADEDEFDASHLKADRTRPSPDPDAGAPPAKRQMQEFFGQHHAGGKRAVWMWRTDDPDKWREYDAKDCEKIERAWQIKGKDAPKTVSIGIGTYFIDLQYLKQRHSKFPDLERDVKRETR